MLRSAPRRAGAPCIALLLVLAGCGTMIDVDGHRVFNPTYAPFLDVPSRDAWQQPERIWEALGLEPGVRIADVGAGTGYFTERFARWTGPGGRVLATDVQEAMLERLRERVASRGLDNVEVLRGDFDDPRLPPGCCDLVFLANVYKEIGARVAFMRRVRPALAPGGRVAIVGFRPGWGGLGPPREVRVPAAQVERELAEAGYALEARHDFLPRQYLLVFAPGDASGPDAGPRGFDPRRDTFAFANQLYWEYAPDPDGEGMRTAPREGPVDNAHRCVDMVRGVRQFHHNARFRPDLAPLDADAYRALAARVFDRDPRRRAPSPDPVEIPGFADLRALSEAHPRSLQAAFGSRVDNYLQRGNWRMVMPFLPRHHRDTAEALRAGLDAGRLPIVHVVTFPQIRINHTVLVFGREETPRRIVFRLYDPNRPDAPGMLVYERADATFRFPRTPYFAGGPVGVYEVYRGTFF